MSLWPHNSWYLLSKYKYLTFAKLATNAVIIIEQGGFCMSFDAF